MSSQFCPAYFETRFRGERVDEEILEFAIITAYSTGLTPFMVPVVKLV